MNKMNKRAQQILKALVERYIRDGVPIGSKTIAEEVPVPLSSATIRNIMADLEDAGYLQSPHTSAGRIPTTMGYRFFVDFILQVQQPSLQNLEPHLQQQLETSCSEKELVESASSIISNLTHLAGIVTTPRRQHFALRHIEFLPLTNRRVLVILVYNEREVQNLIIHTEREYSQSDLQQAANYMIKHYVGMNISQARKALLNAMHDDHQNIESVMTTLFDVAEKTFIEQQDNFVVAGESNLLHMAEESGIQRLKSLFDAFNQKHDILHLFDQCLKTQEIQIFIGKETGYEILDECSLVTSPYFLNGKILGVVGVIGPTRMNYEQVINAVDVTAKLLGAAIKDRMREP